MLLLNTEGELWGLGIPGEGGQVWGVQRQAASFSVSWMQNTVTGFVSDGHCCWEVVRRHGEHTLKKADI